MGSIVYLGFVQGSANLRLGVIVSEKFWRLEITENMSKTVQKVILALS